MRSTAVCLCRPYTLQEHFILIFQFIKCHIWFSRLIPYLGGTGSLILELMMQVRNFFVLLSGVLVYPTLVSFNTVSGLTIHLTGYRSLTYVGEAITTGLGDGLDKLGQCIRGDTVCSFQFLGRTEHSCPTCRTVCRRKQDARITLVEIEFRVVILDFTDNQIGNGRIGTTQ